MLVPFASFNPFYHKKPQELGQIWLENMQTVNGYVILSCVVVSSTETVNII
jgi:hypothetical protein